MRKDEILKAARGWDSGAVSGLIEDLTGVLDEVRRQEAREMAETNTVQFELTELDPPEGRSEAYMEVVFTGPGFKVKTRSHPGCDIWIPGRWDTEFDWKFVSDALEDKQWRLEGLLLESLEGRDGEDWAFNARGDVGRAKLQLASNLAARFRQFEDILDLDDQED